jgi:hypothetical protein
MSTPPHQLDIFSDSRDVMLRNDVLVAITQRDASQARAALTALVLAFPGDPAAAPLAVLARTLEHSSTLALPDHDALARERQAVAGDLAHAARQALGAEAASAWLRPMWRALAVRSAGLPFVAARAEDHAGALWLLGEHWAEAAKAVQGIVSWRRIPAPLAWMTEARWRLDGLDSCWALLAELAWLSPQRLESLLGRLGDPLLTRLRNKFDAGFDASEASATLAWFPAWVLTDTPALAPHLALAQPSQHSPAERGMRLLLDLLALERQGRHHDLVQRRRALRDLHEPLYAAYMATR